MFVFEFSCLKKKTNGCSAFVVTLCEIVQTIINHWSLPYILRRVCPQLDGQQTNAFMVLSISIAQQRKAVKTKTQYDKPCRWRWQVDAKCVSNDRNIRDEQRTNETRRFCVDCKNSNYGIINGWRPFDDLYQLIFIRICARLAISSPHCLTAFQHAKIRRNETYELPMTSFVAKIFGKHIEYGVMIYAYDIRVIHMYKWMAKWIEWLIVCLCDMPTLNVRVTCKVIMLLCN